MNNQPIEHFTQEQVADLAKQLGEFTLARNFKVELHVLINAAIDKLIGESIGEIVFRGSSVGMGFYDAGTAVTIREGEQLYILRKLV